MNGPPGQPRVWRNPKGDFILKGAFSDRVSRPGQPFVAIIDSDKQEVLIPQSNLREADLTYINCPVQCAAEENRKARIRKEKPLPKYSAFSTEARDVDNSKDEPIDLPHRIRPNFLVGKRTRAKVEWSFQKEGSKPPQIVPYCSRSLLTSDQLPMAASRGDLECVKKLLKSGEHIESKGPRSWTEIIIVGEDQIKTKRHIYPETTALYRAADAGCIDIVHFLISQGADVNTRDGEDGRQGDPILFGVIRKGYREMTRLLLEYEARVKFKSNQVTPLHVASYRPKRVLVRLVLDYGAHIDAKDSANQTPLYLASVGGFASIVELLLEEGALPNVVTSEGRTALYKSGGNGRVDVVKLPLQYGASPTLGRGRLGETTLFKAAWYNHTEVVELLLSYEADVNIRNKEQMESYWRMGEKILHDIVAELSKGHAIMNAWGQSAPHAAAYQGHEDMVQMLLSAGADLEAAGSDGRTPLYLAAQQMHKEIIQILLKAGGQLQTERHDPLLALLGGHNREKSGRSLKLITY